MADLRSWSKRLLGWGLGNAAWIITTKLVVAGVLALVTGFTAVADQQSFAVVFAVVVVVFMGVVWAFNGVIWAWRVRGKQPGQVAFPDVEFEIGGRGFATRENTFGELKVPYIARRFINVRITNHEPEKRVSLTFRCRKSMFSAGQVDWWPLSPITAMPFDIEPRTSLKTDLEFEDMPQHPQMKEAGDLELDVRDHLSGSQTPLPTMGTWRPAKDGEWSGAFPPPKDGETS